MIAMLAFLLSALLVLPSCFDDDEKIVEVEVPGPEVPVPGPKVFVCLDADATEVEDKADCPPEPELECSLGFEGTDGNDTLTGGDGPENICGMGGDDTLEGKGNDDTIKGGAGNDTLNGGEGDDTIEGGAGDDTIHGNAGNDTINAGAGNDTIAGDAGNDEIDGGDGIDTVKYIKHLPPDGPQMFLFVNLEEGTANAGLAGNDELTNVENVLCFEEPNDMPMMGTTPAVPHTNYQTTAVTLTGDGGPNHLTGCRGDDVLTGGGGDDVLVGGAGADMLDGGDAGEDGNTAEYPSFAAGTGATIDLSGDSFTQPGDTPDPGYIRIEGVSSTTPHASYGDQVKYYEKEMDDGKTVNLSTIQNLTGGLEGDTLTGDGQDNVLIGGGGSDTLTGGGGDDTLMGGPDVDSEGDPVPVADTLNGGDGNDTLYGDLAKGGTDASPTAIVEVLAGNKGDDTYMKVDKDDRVNENEDTDTDKYGKDTVIYAVAAASDDDEGNKVVGIEMTGDETTPNHVEIVKGTEYNDTLIANDEAGVTILGREGNDTLSGGSGDDTLVGCAGKNTLTGGGGKDFFGVFNNEGDEEKADVIEGFSHGDGDEVHLKGFDMGANVTVEKIEGNNDDVVIKVNGMTVATVKGGGDAPPVEPFVGTPTSADNLKATLELQNADEEPKPKVRIVEFIDSKCSSDSGDSDSDDDGDDGDDSDDMM